MKKEELFNYLKSMLYYPHYIIVLFVLFIFVRVFGAYGTTRDTIFLWTLNMLIIMFMAIFITEKWIDRTTSHYEKYYEVKSK